MRREVRAALKPPYRQMPRLFATDRNGLFGALVHRSVALDEVLG
jgi:hypothetical protein